MHAPDHRPGPRRLALVAIVALTLGPLLPACRMDPPAADQPSTVAAAAEQLRIGDVLWYVDYAAAVEFARAQDKPLWVHFGEHPG